jgi:nickel/cobalt transporter (NicO) family protein
MSNIFPPAKASQVRVRRIHILIFTDAKMRAYGGGVNTLPALLLAAVGVGIGHAVMPDHWLPLAVLSRTRRFRLTRVLRLSLAAALAHVFVSVVLGGTLIVIGLQFRTTVARHTDLVVGGLLVSTGAVFLCLELLGNDHGHRHVGQGQHTGHDHGNHTHDDEQAEHRHGHHHQHDGHEDDGHDRDGHEHAHRHSTTAVLDRPAPAPHNRGARGLAGVLIPFGAAASPDLTILPVFLAASALGVTAAAGSLAAFTVATVATIAGLTTATALGARLFTAPWIERRANLITALTLMAIGGLVAGGLV